MANFMFCPIRSTYNILIVTQTPYTTNLFKKCYRKSVTLNQHQANEQKKKVGNTNQKLLIAFRSQVKRGI